MIAGTASLCINCSSGIYVEIGNKEELNSWITNYYDAQGENALFDGL